MDDATPDPTPARQANATGATDELLPVATAAAVLGITSDAVRARIRRGKLQAVKQGGAWFVLMPTEVRRDSVTTSDATEPASGTTKSDAGRVSDEVRRDSGESDATEMSPTVELVALTETINRLSRQLEERDRRIQEQHERIEQLSGSASMWQTHALHLQNRVQQLEAQGSHEALGAAESDQPDDQDAAHRDAENVTQEGIWRRVVRFLRGH